MKTNEIITTKTQLKDWLKYELNKYGGGGCDFIGLRYRNVTL